MKLQEDLCGTTQDGLLEKYNLHGLNIIVSIIWVNHVRVIWLGDSYIDDEGRFM